MTTRKLSSESSFIQVYRELTGASEIQARSAFMLACCPEDAGDGDGMELDHVLPAETFWEEEKRHESIIEPRSLPNFHRLPGKSRAQPA